MMNMLKLKPDHKAVKAYYNELQQLSLLHARKEGAVSPAFANLLRACGKQFNWTLYEQYLQLGLSRDHRQPCNR